MISCASKSSNKPDDSRRATQPSVPPLGNKFRIWRAPPHCLLGLDAEVVRSQRRRSSLRGRIRLGLGPQVLPQVEEAASQVEQEEHTVHTDTQVNHRVNCRLCIGNHLFCPDSCLRSGDQARLNGPRAFRDWIHAWSIDGIAHGAVGKAKGGITRHLAPDLPAIGAIANILITRSGPSMRGILFEFPLSVCSLFAT